MKRSWLSLYAVMSVSGALVAACGAPQATDSFSRPTEYWNEYNDPVNMGKDFEVAFQKLPKSGKLDVVPWTDTYWPSDHGGIAQRWMVKDNAKEEHFRYDVPGLLALPFMSLEEKKKLSPAEKYDLYMGRYDFPTVAKERKRTSPTDRSWEGLCPGWALAALKFQEPKPVVMKNPLGFEVPFGSSDIKALLTYYQDSSSGAKPANVRSQTWFLGDRCNVDLEDEPENSSDITCRDVNAGAFHIVLTNLLGLRKQGFVIDATKDLEVWNQPVHNYTSRLVSVQGPSVGASPDTVREMIMESKVTYTIEVSPRWETLLGTRGHADHTKTYRYSLELNEAGNIVGGEWLDASFKRSYTEDRPDFMWAKDPYKFEGYFAKVEDIYKASIGQ